MFDNHLSTATARAYLGRYRSIALDRHCQFGSSNFPFYSIGFRFTILRTERTGPAILQEFLAKYGHRSQQKNRHGDQHRRSADQHSSLGDLFRKSADASALVVPDESSARRPIPTVFASSLKLLSLVEPQVLSVDLGQPPLVHSLADQPWRF